MIRKQKQKYVCTLHVVSKNAKSEVFKMAEPISHMDAYQGAGTERGE